MLAFTGARHIPVNLPKIARPPKLQSLLVSAPCIKTALVEEAPGRDKKVIEDSVRRIEKAYGYLVRSDKDHERDAGNLILNQCCGQD